MLVLQAFTFSFVFGEISQNSTLKDIYILGLFPMEGAWTGGLGIQPAAEIAIDYVNRDTNVLPGYRLNMLWNNTKVYIYLCRSKYWLINYFYILWQLGLTKGVLFAFSYYLNVSLSAKRGHRLHK